MATGLSNIFITGLEGETITCSFPTGTINETTISELKLQIETGFEPDEQRLIFGSKQLETMMNGREMTFRDYGLSDKSYIMLVVRLTGGRGPDFIPLRFADVSSEDSFKDIKLTSGGPDWLTLAPGINFEGTCRGRFCQAENRTVVIQRGFYDSTGGTCMLNYEITLLECPMCKQRLNKKDINGVGVYKAKLEVKSKPSEGIEVVVNVEARDKFMYAGCMDDNDKVDYEYILLIVRRF